MYLQRGDSGELKLTFGCGDFSALVTRAVDRGMTPQAYVESLVRDAYRHSLTMSEEEDPGVGTTT